MKKIFAALIIAAVFFAPVTVYAHSSHVVRVGLTRSFANRDSLFVSNTSIWAGYGVEEGFMPITQINSVIGFTVRVCGGRIVISGGGQSYTFGAGYPAQIMANDGEFVALGGYQYRGVIEFIPLDGRVSAVNVLLLEEYLFGVLPAEMSPSFHIDALKAQAVAARTYAFRQIRLGISHRGQNFDICDTTCCQVYRGAGSEHEITNEAVLMTYGLMLFYDGMPILAQYFSSSGGATENSEDVWVEALPYLRSVNEIAEHNPMVWERTFTWAQITNAAASAGAGIGAVNGVSISQLGASGRVLQLTLHGANGQWAIPRSVGVRGFFSSIGGILPSRNFQIAGAEHKTPFITASSGWQNFKVPLNTLKAIDERGAISTVHFAYVYDGETMRRIESTPNIARGGTGITISGRGWGHGVGMSQMGAEGMARAGFNFIEILNHYYTGVEIRRYE